MAEAAVDNRSLSDRVLLATSSGLSPTHIAAAAAEAVARRLELSFFESDRAALFDLFVDDSLARSGAQAEVFERCVASFDAAPELSLGSAFPGRVYELALVPKQRRKQGSHFTSLDLARRLVELSLQDWTVPSSCAVLDPCCGGGAFLLAAAGLLTGPDRSRREIAKSISGRDVDIDALAVTQASLELWVAEESGQLEPVGDFVAADAALDELPPADLIVGNPPFLNQLAASTTRGNDRRRRVRDRFGDAVGAYTDEASVILLASLEVLRDGGRLVLIQPLSLLAARDAAGARNAIVSSNKLRGLWVCPDQVFDAAVSVCAPLVGSLDASADLLRWQGPEVEAASTVTHPEPNETWAPIGAELAGVPRLDLRGSGRSHSTSGAETVADMAATTAGFRDQFYGFKPHVSDDPGRDLNDANQRWLQAMTVGMVDPLRSRWGAGSFAFAGNRFTTPMADLSAITAADLTLGEWTRARAVPKVLVATQTRVVEAIVDIDGVVLPITPLISVEPTGSDVEGDLWLLAALLSAPAITVLANAEQFGSAMSVQALKVSATSVSSLPLPTNRKQWERGADLARAASMSSEANDAQGWRDNLEELGRVMTEAWPLIDRASRTEVFDWWKARLPPWR